MRIINLILIVIFLFSTSSFGVDTKADRKKDDEVSTVEPEYPEGVVYSLPRTGLIIKVTTRLESFVPGPYHQFAEKYLGIEGVQSRATKKWSLLSMKVKSFSEPDPNQMHKAMDSVASLISLTSDGRLAGINTKGNNEKSEVLGSSLNEEELKIPAFTDLLSNEFYNVLADAGTGKENLKFKTLEEKAREAADYIMRLRKKRAYAILDPSDVIPEDGVGYKVFVEEAKRLDAAYVELFTGRTKSVEETAQFIFVPDEKDVRNELLFRFSAEKGVLPETDISGKPIYISLVKNKQAADQANELKVSENPDAGTSGVFYRIPVGADIEIGDGLKQYYKGRAIIAQFGVVAPVPEKLLEGHHALKLDGETGAIRNISETE